MSLEERGLLDSMRLQAWVSRRLPADHPTLARLLTIDPDALRRSLTPAVLSFFEADASGKLGCPELDRYRNDLDARYAERSASGKKGAKAKWDAAPTEMAEPSGVAMTDPEVKKSESSREKAKKGESSVTVVSPELQAWVADYAEGDTTVQQYRRQSRGG